MLDSKKVPGVCIFLLLILISCTAIKEPEVQMVPTSTDTIALPARISESTVELTDEAEFSLEIESTPFAPPEIASESIVRTADLPDYLGLIFPEPGSKYTITSETYLGKLSSIDYFLKDSSACVGVSSYELMEEGDKPSEEQFLAQMSFVLDGVEIKKPNIINSLDILGTSYYDPETGEFLFRTPDGEDFIICWPADFSRPGTYNATFSFTKTSGMVESYSWSFTIEE